MKYLFLLFFLFVLGACKKDNDASTGHVQNNMNQGVQVSVDSTTTYTAYLMVINANADTVKSAVVKVE